MKIEIVKTKDGLFLIGSGAKHKDGYRLKNPFQIKKTKEGVTLLPYDVEIIDTIIPFMDFEMYGYEYIVQPEADLAEFYTKSSTKFIDEVAKRSMKE